MSSFRSYHEEWLRNIETTSDLGCAINVSFMAAGVFQKFPINWEKTTFVIGLNW